MCYTAEMNDLKLEIGEEVVFHAPDGYPDRAKFWRMDGEHYLLKHRIGILSIPRGQIIDVVRPKQPVYAEVPWVRGR
jgi:hypothetical protein